MNRLFWIELQKCWRIKLSSEAKQSIQEAAAAAAHIVATAVIINPYNRNPLDDLEEEDDVEYN